MKYDLHGDEGEVLPNKLGLTDARSIGLAEAEGFLRTEMILFDELNDDTAFHLGYLLRLHSLALSHLYPFGGKLRTVNLSKGGFNFPSSKFLDTTMQEFDQKILTQLPWYARIATN